MCRATYFVEYQFPAALLHTKSSHQHQHYHEVMRVASKQLQDGSMPLPSLTPLSLLHSSLVAVAISFSHRSVFPVLPNSKVLQSWWNKGLIFRVYCRPTCERMVSHTPYSPHPLHYLFSLSSSLAIFSGQGSGLPQDLADLSLTTSPHFSSGPFLLSGRRTAHSCL